MSALTRTLVALAYDDTGSTSNPTQIRVNRTKSVMNIAVENAGTVPVPLGPGASATVIDGTRALSLDGTTAFSIALSPLDPIRYRVTWTGGTNPVLRTDRALVTATIPLTLAVLGNLTMTVTAGSGTPFSAVQVGDQVLVPGVSTGDPTSPFNPLNEGLWYVLTSTSTILTLTRAAGTVFSGASEVVTPADNTFFLVFSSTGVQVGDTLDVSAGFASSAWHSYEVLAVSAKWIEIQSTLPLGAQTGVLPGTAGFVVYTSAKRWILIEADQEVVVRLNGDSGNSNRLSPWLAGDEDLAGTFEKCGTVWKLVVVNMSNSPANVVVASAE